MTPRIVPDATVRSTPSTATSSPNRFGRSIDDDGCVHLGVSLGVWRGSVAPSRLPPDASVAMGPGRQYPQPGAIAQACTGPSRIAAVWRTARSRSIRARGARIGERHDRSRHASGTRGRAAPRACATRATRDPGYTRRRSGRGFSYRDARGPHHPGRGGPPTDPTLWPSRRPGRTSGSVHGPTGTCRPPGGTPGAASSTAITPMAGPRADRTSSIGCSPSPGPCRGSGERCDADLRRRGLPREKVLAAVVRLLELDPHPGGQ